MAAERIDCDPIMSESDVEAAALKLELNTLPLDAGMPRIIEICKRLAILRHEARVERFERETGVKWSER